MAVNRQLSWVTSNVVARVVIAFSLAIGAIIAADSIKNLVGVRDLYGLVFAACLLPLCWFYHHCFPTRTDRFGFVCAYFSAALVLDMFHVVVGRFGMRGPGNPVPDDLVLGISGLCAMYVGSKVYKIATRWRPKPLQSGAE